MGEVGCDGVRCRSVQRESVAGTALAILSTKKNVEVVATQIKLIVQGVGGSPAPACANLVGGLVCGTHIALVINLIGWKIATPCPTALVVIDLSAIDQTLNGLNLYKPCSVQTVTDALIVGTLAVNQTENWVAGV